VKRSDARFETACDFEPECRQALELAPGRLQPLALQQVGAVGGLPQDPARFRLGPCAYLVGLPAGGCYGGAGAFLAIAGDERIEACEALLEVLSIGRHLAKLLIDLHPVVPEPSDREPGWSARSRRRR
jgi:hypothetical protein